MIWLCLLIILLPFQLLSQTAETDVMVHSTPLSSGRINPMLFGNFVELLDDVVPGMWAEMLNDRAFSGVTRVANWSYYDGTPDFCDREWDKNSTWSFDAEHPFNGGRSARLASSRHQAATLTQSGLAVKRGMTYNFSGWFRSEGGGLVTTVRLKTLLPTGAWMILASANLPRFSPQWSKYSARLTSIGETDRVLFELLVKGTGQV